MVGDSGLCCCVCLTSFLSASVPLFVILACWGCFVLQSSSFCCYDGRVPAVTDEVTMAGKD